MISDVNDENLSSRIKSYIEQYQKQKDTFSDPPTGFIIRELVSQGILMEEACKAVTDFKVFQHPGSTGAFPPASNQSNTTSGIVTSTIHEGATKSLLPDMPAINIEIKKLSSQGSEVIAEQKTGAAQENKTQEPGSTPPSPEIRTESEIPSENAEETAAANPQIENGYTRIANEILEELARVSISGHGWRLLMAVFRKTYGWNKKTDWISNSQFVSMTGLCKQRVNDAMKELVQKKIVSKSGVKVSFQKNHTQWQYKLKSQSNGKPLLPKDKSNGKPLPVTEEGYGNGKTLSSNGKPFPQKKLLQKKKDKDYVEPETGSTSPAEDPKTLKSPTRGQSPKKQKVTNPDIGPLLEYLSSAFEVRFGSRPVMNYGAIGKQLKRLLEVDRFTPDAIKEEIDWYLQSKKGMEHPTPAGCLSADSFQRWQVENPEK